jgi:hypothetical protein
VPTMVTLRGSWPSKFIKLAPWVTAKSVYLQHNVMLYIQKSVSENVGNCSHRGRKIQKFSGGEYPQTPTPLHVNAIPHQTFCYQQTIYHFSTLGIVWSLFVDGPPTDEFLKNALSHWVIKFTIRN